MHRQKRQRLAIGLTGALMAATLFAGAVSVAADDSDVLEPHDVNVGMEATGLASKAPTFTVSNVVVSATGSDVGTGATVPTIEGTNDRRPDASDG